MLLRPRHLLLTVLALPTLPGCTRERLPSAGSTLAELLGGQGEVNLCEGESMPAGAALTGFTLSDPTMSEEEFNTLIDEAVALYADQAVALGATLQAEKVWSSETLNAYASRNDTIWRLTFYGGYARHMSKDAFSEVICHEIGHHFGGFPFLSTWAAAEGQSDYFAAKDCLRRWWRPQVEANAALRDAVNPTLKLKCDLEWPDQADQDLCYRVATAALEKNRAIAAVYELPLPSPDTRDEHVVPVTSTDHPVEQCRFDTMLAGGLCELTQPDAVVPGLAEALANDSLGSERAAAPFACTRVVAPGARPRCWFKSRLYANALALESASLSDDVGNGNGIPEPGERLEAILTVRNDASVATSVLGATVSDAGTAASPAVDVVEIPGSATTEVRVTFTAPSSACGSFFAPEVRLETDFGDVAARLAETLGQVVATASAASTEGAFTAAAASSQTSLGEAISVSASEASSLVLEVVATFSGVSNTGGLSLWGERAAGTPMNVVYGGTISQQIRGRRILSGAAAASSWRLAVKNENATAIPVTSWSFKLTAMRCAAP